MNWKNIILASSAVVILTACSGGAPSGNDVENGIKNTLLQRMNATSFLTGETETLDGIDIKLGQHKCHKADGGRYRCTFSYTIKDKATGESDKDSGSMLFEEQGKKWVPVDEYQG